MSLQKNLSNAMKAIRYSRDCSLTEFAKELDISRSSLQEILNGTGNPRMDTVEHIAKQLDMDPLTLLSCSYSEDEFQVAMPLLKITDSLYKLPCAQKHQFVELFQALVLLLTDPES